MTLDLIGEKTKENIKHEERRPIMCSDHGPELRSIYEYRSFFRFISTSRSLLPNISRENSTALAVIAVARSGKFYDLISLLWNLNMQSLSSQVFIRVIILPLDHLSALQIKDVIDSLQIPKVSENFEISMITFSKQLYESKESEMQKLCFPNAKLNLQRHILKNEIQIICSKNELIRYFLVDVVIEYFSSKRLAGFLLMTDSAYRYSGDFVELMMQPLLTGRYA